MARIRAMGGTGERGMKGTDSPTTARKTSGWFRAQAQAVGAPQSWPMTTAVSWPSAFTRPRMSFTTSTWL